MCMVHPVPAAYVAEIMRHKAMKEQAAANALHGIRIEQTSSIVIRDCHVWNNTDEGTIYGKPATPAAISRMLRSPVERRLLDGDPDWQEFKRRWAEEHGALGDEEGTDQ